MILGKCWETEYDVRDMHDVASQFRHLHTVWLPPCCARSMLLNALNMWADLTVHNFWAEEARVLFVVRAPTTPP